jgi:dihydroorotate dehydrogenase (fumarate)
VTGGHLIVTSTDLEESFLNMAPLKFEPPLLNSANPWATTAQDLKDLYSCPFTGAVTTRTCTLAGFSHDDRIHQYAFFEPNSLKAGAKDTSQTTASINTLGYSPIPLSQTLENIKSIVDDLGESELAKQKPFIVSITGSVEQVTSSIGLIVEAQLQIRVPLFAEINLSCPNITGKPPPAFSFDGLCEYFQGLADISVSLDGQDMPGILYLPLQCGIKTPPYSNPDNFAILKAALMQFVHKDTSIPLLKLPLTFITATNTLGCSLVLDSDLHAVLSSADGSGIGGVAGAPLHPLALGNVRMIKTMLDSEPALKDICIIGVGGVEDHAGFQRMQKAGASIVGVGTALGRKGISVFESILTPL